MTTTTIPKPNRKPVPDVPHTDEVDILIKKGHDYIDVYSGHIPIALQTMTLRFSVMEPADRVLLWGITHELIQEIANAEGWTYENEYLTRFYSFEHGTGEELIAHEKSANRVFDGIWALKYFIQSVGVWDYLKLCRTLAGGDEAASASARKQLEEYHVLTA